MELMVIGCAALIALAALICAAVCARTNAASVRELSRTIADQNDELVRALMAQSEGYRLLMQTQVDRERYNLEQYKAGQREGATLRGDHSGRLARAEDPEQEDVVHFNGQTKL